MLIIGGNMLNIRSEIRLLGCIVVFLNIVFSHWQLVWAQENVPDPPVQNQIKLKTGWIDAISKTDIVIDDLASPLAGVTVIDQQGHAANLSSLAVGKYIAFRRQGEKTEIHLVANQEKRPELPADSNSQLKQETQREVIRQIDGVWKN